MLNRILSILVICILISQTIMANQYKTDDQKFETLANQYIAQLLKQNPEWATRLGEHKFDDKLNDYNLAAVRENRLFTETFLKDLNKIPFDKLSRVNNVDARIMKHSLEYNLFQIDVLREYEWNPMSYNVGGALNSLISRDFGPLKDRLMSAKARLELIPNVTAAAKANLKNPPKVYTETAILQNKGVINLIRGDLPDVY